MFFRDFQGAAKDEQYQVRSRQQDLEHDNEGEKTSEGKDKSCEGRAGLDGDGILRGQFELQSHDCLHGVWYDRPV